MDIISYIKEHLRITLSIIKTPQAFFEGMKGEGTLKPFVYMLFSFAVYYIGVYLGFFLLNASSSRWLYYLSDLIGFLGIFYQVNSVMFFLIVIALIHLEVRIVGGKGSFNDTFKVMCYAVAPLKFAWVFMIPRTFAWVFLLPYLFGMLYIFYIEFVGIAVISSMTRKKAFIAVLIQIISLILIYCMIVVLIGILAEGTMRFYR